MQGENKQPKGANSDHLYQKGCITNTFTTVDEEWKETEERNSITIGFQVPILK